MYLTCVCTGHVCVLDIIIRSEQGKKNMHVLNVDVYGRLWMFMDVYGCLWMFMAALM